MTSGQQAAIAQLKLIASADPHAVEILRIAEPDTPDGFCAVRITLGIGDIERTADGLPLRDRESFEILIPPDFPFDQPSTLSTHTRFAGWPHVQWKRSLCLFQSSTEWNPSDGMFGYIDRLWLWIGKAAVNQLDPAGMPLHPPAVYAGEKGRLIIPTADTPQFETPFWVGAVVLKDHTRYLEISSWHTSETIPPDEKLGVAVLMGKPVAWEFPSKGADLIQQLDQNGLPPAKLYKLLEIAASVTPVGEPLHLILGTPMRGTSGEQPKQHLSVWQIEDSERENIVYAIEKEGDYDFSASAKEKIRGLNLEVLSLSPITWCPVIEARPETTIRRDFEAPLAFFRGKTVALWGCGALGSQIATMLCRAGIDGIHLWDTGLVTPGIMVRQDFLHADIGRLKVEAVADRLKAINPLLAITPKPTNVSSLLKEGSDWTEGADIVIDATASSVLRQRLEMIWNRSPRHVPVAAAMIDQDAQIAIAGVVDESASGGPWDLFRKSKVEVLRRPEFRPYADAFFPENPRPAFQPEPGCSDATFRGSAADTMALAAAALNLVATTLAKNATSTAHLFHMPRAGASRTLEFSIPPDIVSDAGNYEIRVSPAALKEIKATIAQNRRLRSRKVETGGLLWGEWDEAMRIVWVTDATGPPPDSQHSEQLFVCGTVGTAEEAIDRRRSSRNAISYIGSWHTHPVSTPVPSNIDLKGMTDIMMEHPAAPRSSLLMILGKHDGRDVMGNYIFERQPAGKNFHLMTCAQAWHPLEKAIL